MSKITSIEVQKKNKERYNIYVDDKFFMGISEDTLITLNLYKGKEVDKKDLEKLMHKEEYSKAYNYALYILSFRMRSRSELFDKMKEKEFDENHIEDVLYKLEKLNYINDEEFVKAFIRTRLNSRKYGPIRIQNDLYVKGVDSTLTKNLLEVIYPFELQVEICKEIADKRKDRYSKDEKHKLVNFLQRRGFNFEVINTSIKDIY